MSPFVIIERDDREPSSTTDSSSTTDGTAGEDPTTSASSDRQLQLQTDTVVRGPTVALTVLPADTMDSILLFFCYAVAKTR